MLANGAKETTTTTGTGTVTLSAVTGFPRFSQVLSVGQFVDYAIQDGNNWEWGVGKVAAGNTLERTPHEHPLENPDMNKILATCLVVLASVTAALVAAPVQAADLSNYAENKIVDALLRGQTLGAPATGYWALGTDTCTDAGPGTEVSGGSYARVSVVSSLANFAGTQSAGSTVASTGTGGTTSNNAAITFPQSTAAWGNLQSVWLMDATSAGNRWICINLTTPFSVSAAGVTVSFPAGSLTFQIDN